MTAEADKAKTYPPPSVSNAVASATILRIAQMRPKEEILATRSTQGQAPTHVSDVGKVVIILTSATYRMIERTKVG
jgi:hypothetical protein